MQKTTLRQNIQSADRQWYVVDAAGKTLGQLAVAVANALRGKNRVDYTPHVDNGNYVVVLNAEKIAVSGQKESQKMYYRHSGYLGHLKTEKLSEVRDKKPTRIMREAVSGMLPRTKHRKNQLRRLFLVVGDVNPHEAQKPELLKID
jgi:large subunit ribosomal protein L13